MGWSTVPVSAGENVTAAQWNEVVAALNERLVAVGWTPAATVAVGAPILASKMNALRSSIEGVCQKYFDPDAREANHYYKSTLLTQAIGATNWTGGSTVAIGDPVKAVHVNELRLAINKLDWTWKAVEVNYDTTRGQYKVGNGSSYASWAAAWTGCKSDWSLASFSDTNSNALQFRDLSSYQSGSGWELFEKSIQQQQCCYIDVWLADPGVSYDAARLVFNGYLQNDGGSGAGSSTVYEDADFAGSSHTMAVDDYVFPGGPFYATVTPTVGATNVYSFKTNPADPTPDDYYATDANNKQRGWFAQIAALSCHFNWTYHA